MKSKPVKMTEPTMTLDDLQYQARSLHQRAMLFRWAADQIVECFSRSEPGDLPLTVPTATGGQEPPLRGVVAEVRAELLRGAWKASDEHAQLIATLVVSPR